MTDTFLGTGDRVMNKLGKYIILNIYIIVKGYNMKLNSTTKFQWNGPRDALTQKKAGFPCNGLNAGSYFISQDEA